MSQTQFQLVQQFHDKFGIERPDAPIQLDADTLRYRVGFIREELSEYLIANRHGDLEGQLDALVDLVYVALGTADMQGFPFDEAFAEVQRANMQKRRASSPEESKRGSSLDVVKPEGWTPPDIAGVLESAGA